jgi:alkanesulfonate monooxygenase SsuD/methylene tetrahydromethanopterin reductase-like flavin-dependent oxidoreductase (luciferase family)
VTFEGRFWQLNGAAMEPKPWQKPYPPLWLGGGHINALRRAVRLGGGFVGAGSSTTAQFRQHVAELRTLLVDEGRDPSGFQLAKRVYVHVDDDVARSRRVVTDELAQIYDHVGADLTPVALFGSPEVCADGVREVIDAGAEMILFTPLRDEAAQLEFLAAAVIPGIS